VRLEATGEVTDENQCEHDGQKDANSCYDLMPPLVPGGRVLNPQSYHSAFRISSTRHEEAQYNDPFLTLIFLGTKN
jgi:hypothetical protein